MKKIFLLALSASLLTVSCDKSDDFDWSNRPQSYVYATVISVDADATDDDSNDEVVEGDIYFQLDSKETFVVTENLSKVDFEDLEVGMRLITGVTFSKSTDDIYDYTATLYEMVEVVLGERAEVSTKEESEAIADDEFSYIAADILLSRGYLNLFVGFQSEDIYKANVYLVDNNFDEPAETDDDYLNLELRFDSAGEEAKGDKYERYISFDMLPYREMLDGKKGVLLRVKTQKSGTISLKVNSKELFPED
ncbi:MAG: NigD-like C-terminal domain-containing protein [Rikenellaceae bacterium]